MSNQYPESTRWVSSGYLTRVGIKWVGTERVRPLPLRRINRRKKQSLAYAGHKRAGLFGWGRRGEKRNKSSKLNNLLERREAHRGEARASEARKIVLSRTKSACRMHLALGAGQGSTQCKNQLLELVCLAFVISTMVFEQKGTVNGRGRLSRWLRPQKKSVHERKNLAFQFRENAQKGAQCTMSAEKRTKLSADTKVTTAELSLILGITSRRVRQLADEGVIAPEAKNSYNLADSVQGYIKFLAKSLPDEDDTKLERAKRVAEAQLKASKAKIAKLEAEELEGKMHRSEDVAEFTTDLIATIRSALMALPGRLAVDAVACKTAAEAQVVIRTEVYRTMEEIAAYEYDPAKYEERVRERLAWEASGESDEG